MRTHVSIVAGAAALALLTAGCSSDGVGGGESAGDAQTLRIGFVSTETGSLAPFGEANAFVVDQMEDYFAENPIEVDGEEVDVEIVVKDAQSDSTRAGEVTADLINGDEVDVVISSGTPDVANPVSEQCEANSVPCITTVAPWQPFAIRGGDEPADLQYSHHFFWGLEDVAAVYSDIWSQVETNGQAGGLFPNDPDGQAWSANFPALTADTGVTIENPGLYTNGTKDFSAQLSAFKGKDILLGVPIPPDFTTFWKQAKQQGYRPKVATIGKALLFPSAVEALGDIADGLGTEVWWTPTAPFESSLTGQSAQELADAFEEGTGQQWTQPLGFAHALFEVAAAAVQKAGSTDAEAIDEALDGLSVETVVGPVAWGADDSVPPYIAKTPLTGGQWRAVEGGEHPFDLVVVSNALAPEIPAAGKVEPLP
ncbi:ABC transporter substrate-binding protein [Nocardioides sp. zg-579]|uniref:ABC transporter substrate-binding protein n=1 Tax=Nocardioides marmotae TaxID=2663857 RepID=A0A6I3JE53_9ACTN|nr:ABC transporter substrate-binding protein [Nocardioides marmotae]MCR6032824.1 ABC transporter substrate-binding protein [Gordonia jinghuaiqii]MTB96474.1 ABC transporter substrate-binding protein [Nocardioides marmotae]QKE02002.1 ABC transporter substrate-binding protein [Nocardioides marmotae]